ncbi:toprim domain-containing protein [Ochrobactrum sp. CM-21-5]|nr:toprim domain-containing protein [Ochrobactrum sp. CM-21-5]MBC2886465.1 toprim domain-containing protein [Ochrobactrum sp. CM-21-5]
MTIIDVKSAATILGGETFRGNRVLCPGPGHSKSDRSLQVTFKADGSFTVRSFAGDDFRECRDYVKARLGLSDDQPVSFATPLPVLDVDKLRKQQTATDIWARSIPIAGTLAEVYLHSRHLAYDGEALRFWPGGRAMVGLITDAITGVPIGIHRTFLDRDGNRIEKKMLGAAYGGVVRLSGDDEVSTGLSICEGIETGLGALRFGYGPVWACLSEGTMRRFPVIDGVEALTIFADNDRNRVGLRAADECARRWHEAGHEVTIIASETVGEDIADIAERAAA